MRRWRCRSYRVLLVELAESTLPARRRRRLQRHLLRCPDCTRDLAALRDLPPLMRSTPVADPGEEFWLRQRQAISHAIRNAPPPRSAAGYEWLQAAFQVRAGRYAAAAAAALLIGLGVYRSAVRQRLSSPGTSAAEVTALDTQSLVALRELTQVLIPGDDWLAHLPAGDEAQLAALPLNDFIGDSIPPEAPRATELDDTELERIGELIGGLG